MPRPPLRPAGRIPRDGLTRSRIARPGTNYVVSSAVMSIAGSLDNLFTRALIVRSFPSSALTRLRCSLAHRDEGE